MERGKGSATVLNYPEAAHRTRFGLLCIKTVRGKSLGESSCCLMSVWSSCREQEEEGFLQSNISCLSLNLGLSIQSCNFKENKCHSIQYVDLLRALAYLFPNSGLSSFCKSLRKASCFPQIFARPFGGIQFQPLLCQQATHSICQLFGVCEEWFVA